MNIFYLDKDPKRAAVALCDKHVVKMPVETVQMLATISFDLGGGMPAKINGEPYKPVKNKNHRCIVWAKHSLENWEWLIQHGLHMFAEYCNRYDKEHGSYQALLWCMIYANRPVSKEFTQPALAMPEKYWNKDRVKAYRNFYINDKKYFATWKSPAKPPYWWK